MCTVIPFDLHFFFQTLTYLPNWNNDIVIIFVKHGIKCYVTHHIFVLMNNNNNPRMTSTFSLNELWICCNNTLHLRAHSHQIRNTLVCILITAFERCILIAHHCNVGDFFFIDFFLRVHLTFNFLLKTKVSFFYEEAECIIIAWKSIHCQKIWR